MTCPQSRHATNIEYPLAEEAGNATFDTEMKLGLITSTIASVKNAKIRSAKIRTAKGAKSAGIVRYIDRKVGKGKTKVKGRKYYYKVRAFRKVNGKRVYGAYSKAAK